MRPKGPRAAWIQGTILIVAIAAIATAFVLQNRKPFDRETLAIEVGQLRSQAAETAELLGNAAAQRLAPVFTRVHADQLAEKVHAVASSLRSTPPRPEVRDAHAAATGIASALEQALHAIASDEHAAAGQAAAVRALAARSDALSKQLEPHP